METQGILNLFRGLQMLQSYHEHDDFFKTDDTHVWAKSAPGPMSGADVDTMIKMGWTQSYSGGYAPERRWAYRLSLLQNG